MVRSTRVFVITVCIASVPAMAVDIPALWDFNNPALSEERFRSALETAVGDEALILETQIARTYVLRKDFGKAQELLLSIEPQADAAGAEARARYWLERGRSYASHQHPAESQTPESKQLARSAYTKALNIAKEAQLDALAIDAIHMFAFVDTAPAEQLKRGQEALALLQASNQPEAKRWEASVLSNIGEALYELGRYDEALEYFTDALALRERGTNPKATRNARWHVARVLRVQNRVDEALAIQLRLERESDAENDPRYYVFEELELLYRAKGSEDRAQYYANRAKSLAE